MSPPTSSTTSHPANNLSSSTSSLSLSDVETRGLETTKITMDEPLPLRASRYSKRFKLWKHTTNGAREDIEQRLPTSIRILTWNVDFAAKQCKPRLQRLLDHIQQVIFECKNGERPPPCCICFQEIHEDAFRTILANQWVKDHFVVTPTSRQHWPEHATYGAVTLVSRTVPVTCVHSIEFSNSRMQRNALVVDVKLSVPAPFQSRLVTLRIANTHLESLPQGEPARRGQLRLIADFLKEEGLHGAIVCGDMNAIAHSDDQLPTKNGLVDAWKSGEIDEGMTWGFQPKCEFPPGRLDKVLYVPGMGYTLSEPQRVGVDLKTPQGQWVSDHVGLLTTVHIVSG